MQIGRQDEGAFDPARRERVHLAQPHSLVNRAADLSQGYPQHPLVRIVQDDLIPTQRDGVRDLGPVSP